MLVGYWPNADYPLSVVNADLRHLGDRRATPQQSLMHNLASYILPRVADAQSCSS